MNTVADGGQLRHCYECISPVNSDFQPHFGTAHARGRESSWWLKRTCACQSWGGECQEREQGTEAPSDVDGDSAALLQASRNDEAGQLRDHLVLQPPPQRPSTVAGVVGLLPPPPPQSSLANLMTAHQDTQATFRLMATAFQHRERDLAMSAASEQVRGLVQYNVQLVSTGISESLAKQFCWQCAASGGAQWPQGRGGGGVWYLHYQVQGCVRDGHGHVPRRQPLRNLARLQRSRTQL